MAWIASTLALVVVACGDATGPFRDVTYERAQAVAAQEGKVVLVDFFTTWCGPCKKLDATTWKDAQVQAWLAKHCVAIKLDAEQHVELARRFDVGAFPTIVITKPDGTVVDSLVGYRDATTFLSEAADALAGKTALMRALEAVRKNEKDATARMSYGRELARAGRHEQALAEYLWCFDSGRESPGFGGVRLSFLLRDILDLAAALPAASQALRDRRDAAEARILSNTLSRHDVADVTALNRVLDEPLRTLQLHDRLRAAGALSADGKFLLAMHVLEPLVDARRYEDALELFSKPTGFVSGHIRNYEALRTFRARTEEPASIELDAIAKESVVGQSAPMYEALAGAGRTEAAAEVADLLLAFDPSRATYVTLIERAARAGRADTARSIAARGSAALADPADKKAIAEAVARVGAPK